MEVLSKYKFAAVAVLAGLLTAVTLSLTYGDNFQAATIAQTKKAKYFDQARKLLKKDAVKFEKSFATFETETASLNFLKASASKFQKYCRYFALAKVKYGCGNFVVSLINDVDGTVESGNVEDAKLLIDDAYETLFSKFGGKK